MIVTLSDYILEQEVSTASCDDITMEQAFAEIRVRTALANAYAKQFLMLEYASDYTMEADDETATQTNTATEEKKTGKFKAFLHNIWEAIKTAIFWLRDRFKDFGRWIKSKFSKKTVEDAEKVAESGTDEEVAAIVDACADQEASGGSDDTVDTPADVSAPKPKRLTAFELLTVYDTTDCRNIVDDISRNAAELSDAFTNICEAKGQAGEGAVPDQVVLKMCKDLNTALEKVATGVDKLQMRSKKAGWTEVAGDKRKTLKRMCTFIKWMEDEGDTKLNNAVTSLEYIAKHEMPFKQTTGNAEAIKSLKNAHHTIFNLTHALADIAVSTKQMVDRMKTAQAKYNARSAYEEKQKAAGNPNYQ